MCPACPASARRPRRAYRQLRHLDGVYANLDAITKKKAKEALAANREKAYLSRQLVTIDTAVPLDIRWRDCQLPQPDDEALRGLYKKFRI